MLTPALFDRFRLTQMEKNLGVYGVHVYQEGQGEIEHRFRSDDRIEVYSASKTFTSLAIGMCQAEGRLKLTDHVLDFFPEWASVASEGSEAITLLDMLHMCSGKDYVMFETSSGMDETAYTTDWAELYFRGRVTTTPGTHFFYANANTYMLGRVVEQVSGQVLRDYLTKRLFEPLRILGPAWNTCSRGHSLGALGLQLTTSELSRVGRLMLQGGVWDEAQLVPSSYVDAMHTDVVDPAGHFSDPESNAGYGYQVWLNTTPGTWRADGMYGQYSIVLPDQHAVVTTTSHNEPCPCDIIRAVFADIVPLLQ